MESVRAGAGQNVLCLETRSNPTVAVSQYDKTTEFKTLGMMLLLRSLLHALSNTTQAVEYIIMMDRTLVNNDWLL